MPKERRTKFRQCSVNFNREVFFFSNANEGSHCDSDSITGHARNTDGRKFCRQSVQRHNQCGEWSSHSHTAGPFVVANESGQGGVVTPVCQPKTASYAINSR